MKNEKTFSARKAELVVDSEAAYGKEARAKYGDKAMNTANTGLMALTQAQYDAWNALGAKLRRRLETAVTRDLAPDSGEERERCDLYRRWLAVTVKDLTPQKHQGIARCMCWMGGLSLAVTGRCPAVRSSCGML